jgi:hypothetical protein
VSCVFCPGGVPVSISWVPASISWIARSLRETAFALERAFSLATGAHGRDQWIAIILDTQPGEQQEAELRDVVD